MRSFLILLMMSWCTASVSATTEDNGWELKRQQEGISVFTRKVDGSKHRAIRAEMVIPQSPRAAAALVRDTKACSRWAALCKESYVFDRVSSSEAYVYTYNDVPWPVKDRDALAHVIWHRDETSGAISMVATATDGLMEPTKAVRIVNGVTRWWFIPTTEDDTRVVTEAHIDPAGPTPAWITNLLLVDSPYQTLFNMRDVLASGEYDNAEYH